MLFIEGKFVLFSCCRDFDANLYVCNGAFAFLTQDFFERLTKTFVFPAYVVVHIGLLLLLAVGLLQKWRYYFSVANTF